MTAFFVGDARSDQSLALSKLLRSSGHQVVAVGPTRPLMWKQRYDGYKRAVDSSLGVVMPTTAAATRAALQTGSAKIGRYELTTECADVCFDKPASFDLATAAGLRVPKTVTLTEFLRAPFYPAFIKDAYERGGTYRGRVDKASDIPRDLPADEYLAQEYVPGHSTLGLAFLARGGEITSYASHREAISQPLSGGSAVLIEKAECEELLQAAIRLVSAVRYDGWGLLEMRQHSGTGELYFMEVNAKIWASIEFTMRAYPEFFFEMFGFHHGLPRVERALYWNRLLLAGFSAWPGLRVALTSQPLHYPGFVRAKMARGVRRLMRDARSRIFRP